MSKDTSQEHGNRLFFSIWGSLLALTLFEVFLAYEQLGVELTLIALMSLSLIKAGLIMAYFMHLRFEKLNLVLTLVPALVICITLLTAFFPDSVRVLNMTR
ncbi:MAG: cytochrome C oxidase subunit IV family protein [Acidobacteriota bacterium]